jgi:hypothetical protein
MSTPFSKLFLFGSDKMNFIKLQGHEEAWNQFCYDHAWFWHTTYWMQYVQNARFGVSYKNHSFFVTQESDRERHKVVGIVPLIQEDDQLTSPGFDDDKEILSEVKRIALENGCKRVQVSADIKSYLPIPSYTCVLDLADVRPTKGHKAAIKKAEKCLSWREITDIDRFKADYFRIAGKATRPDRTFELLGQWIKQGYGTLLEAEFDELTAGYAYILHWRDYAYYFMSCVEPAFRQYNVSHFLQAKAFEILRQKGICRYELGEQVENALHSQPSEKERNISLFKRGFGGQVIRSPASEYFFDRDYCREVINKRLENYIRSEYENNLIYAKT